VLFPELTVRELNRVVYHAVQSERERFTNRIFTANAASTKESSHE